MARNRLAAPAFAALLVSCSGAEIGNDPPPGGFVPESSDSTCFVPADCAFGEACEGGICVARITPADAPQVCESDADCEENQACALSSGACVDLADEPTPTTDPDLDCTSGDSRLCGSKDGCGRGQYPASHRRL